MRFVLYDDDTGQPVDVYGVTSIRGLRADRLTFDAMFTLIPMAETVVEVAVEESTPEAFKIWRIVVKFRAVVDRDRRAWLWTGHISGRSVQRIFEQVRHEYTYKYIRPEPDDEPMTLNREDVRRMLRQMFYTGGVMA